MKKPKKQIVYHVVAQQGINSGKWKIMKETLVGGERTSFNTLYKNLLKGEVDDLEFRLLNNLKTSKK